MTSKITENKQLAKYQIKISYNVEGVVEVQDIVGALFGQTEGLLNDLDLRDLQKNGRIGRIKVDHNTEKGKSSGIIIIPCSLNQQETAILAATLESVDRVGPCDAELKIVEIQDVRSEKLDKIKERATLLLRTWQQVSPQSSEMSRQIQDSLEPKIIKYKDCDAGDRIVDAEEVIIVEGRNDLTKLFEIGARNTIATNGVKISSTVVELCNTRKTIAFFDGDRGGDSILKSLLQLGAKIDFVASGPEGKEVEDLTQIELSEALQRKMPLKDHLDLMKQKEEHEEGRRKEEEALRKQKKKDRLAKTVQKYSQEKFLDRSGPPVRKGVKKTSKKGELPGKWRNPRIHQPHGMMMDPPGMYEAFNSAPYPPEYPGPMEFPARMPEGGFYRYEQPTAGFEMTAPPGQPFPEPPMDPGSPEGPKRHGKENIHHGGHIGNRDRPESKPGPRGKAPEKRLPPLNETLLKDMQGLIASNQALLLNEKNDVLVRTTNTNVLDQLAAQPNVKMIIMDGVVTQRLVDKAAENRIKTLIAVNIKPSIKITKEQGLELIKFKDYGIE